MVLDTWLALSRFNSHRINQSNIAYNRSVHNILDLQKLPKHMIQKFKIGLSHVLISLPISKASSHWIEPTYPAAANKDPHQTNTLFSLASKQNRLILNSNQLNFTIFWHFRITLKISKHINLKFLSQKM